MPESLSLGTDIGIEEMSYTPKVVVKSEEPNALFMPVLEDLDVQPKTLEELMTEMKGDTLPEKKSVAVTTFSKATQDETAANVHKQFQLLLNDKKQREISAGFSGALLICAFGVFSALLMLVSGNFNVIHSFALLIV